MPKNHFKDLGIGIGLRVPHLKYIFENKPQVDFFEIISENFMVDGGPPLTNLRRILENYPVVQHGVSLNIASTEELDFNYLKRLKELTKLTRTPWLSDHLCWTKSNGHNFHDLLPVPYTEENARFIANKARIVQDYLELPFALENLSTYISFKESEMTEWEFYKSVVEESGCYMLFDVNNVYVSSVNHHFNPYDYLSEINWQRVVQVHLAGHSELPDGTLLDTHSTHVKKEVWDLYSEVLKYTDGISTLLEWDEDIPDFETTYAEAQKAKNFIIEKSIANKPPRALFQYQNEFGYSISLPLIIDDDGYECQYENYKTSLVENVVETEEKHPLERIATYNEQYWFRLINVMQEEYPFLCEIIGLKKFNSFIIDYLTEFPSRSYSLNHLSDNLVEFIQNSKVWYNPQWAKIAELEYIMIQLFDKAETAYDFDGLKEVSESSRVKLAETFCIYQEDWDVVASYREFKKTGKVPDSFNEQKGYWFLNRHEKDYHIDKISFPQLAILQQIKNGYSIEKSLEQIHENFDEEVLNEIELNIEKWFYEWTLKGIFKDKLIN